MDELNMRHALQRYVSAEPPPFSLAANDLITLGRRRQRWRLAAGLGGGGVVTALAVFSTTLIASGDGQMQYPGGCDVVLPIGMGSSMPLPSGSNSWHPSASNSFRPTSGPPPTATAEPSSPPLQSRSFYPTPEATPTPWATPMPPGTGFPDPTTTALPPMPATTEPRMAVKEVSQARREAMSCFLKHRMLELLPEATYLPPSLAPMEPERRTEVTGDGGAAFPVYSVRTWVVHQGRICMLAFYVRPLGPPASPGPSGEKITTPGGNTAYLSQEPYTKYLTVVTKKSRIGVWMEGDIITVDQAIALADSKELDLFR